MEAKAWICPRCLYVKAPHVDECQCQRQTVPANINFPILPIYQPRLGGGCWTPQPNPPVYGPLIGPRNEDC